MAKYFRFLSLPVSRFKQLNLKVKIVLVFLLALVFASGLIVVSEQPGFCNSCHIMHTYYDSWKTSFHSEVNCLDCHLRPGFAGHVKGKINGLSQAVDCIVGRVGTKPNATIEDVSCLRSECHSIEKLASQEIDCNGIKFAHRKHVEEVVGGITISCGTCHSHFEGDEHFNVNSDVCFSCHFLKDSRSQNKLVQTNCRDCHEVPNKVIKRGLVTVNHTEFVSYKASCEDSCHRGQVEKLSNVTDSVCLNCHSFRKAEDVDSVELHKVHTSGEKVECFACHGKVSHGPTEDAPLAVTMDCKSCHSDTHNVQLGVYTAHEHPLQKESSRVLSPMFLTHVECTGCHIEQRPVGTGTVESIGKVAKAVPEACDKCHEPGTGQRYIPFWQGEIKKLHNQVSGRLNELQDVAQTETDQNKAGELKSRIAQAKALVDSVEADGSWGVHNLKYTEAILLKAKEIIGEVQ
jgi:nitrate/TMAO reductase-like tetraheme cytochrome c subunit